MAIQFVKRGVQKALRAAGLEVRRTRPPQPYAPPPLYDDPLEALYLVTQHRWPAAFRCPIEAVVDLQGFGLRPGAWRPFVAAMWALTRGGEAEADALLERFNAAFRPRTAAEAIPGFGDAPSLFADLPPHLFYLTPWSIETTEQIQGIVERFVQGDNQEHGRGDLTLADGGFPTFGPVTPSKRALELRRLSALHGSLLRTGFDRSRGDNLYTMIRRGRELRWFSAGDGYHRTAVMAALGADWAPAQFFPDRAVVDVAEIEYWPQVRRGLWSRRQALAYVDHLFEHDAADWARLRVDGAPARRAFA
jgi:hypothetical protein